MPDGTANIPTMDDLRKRRLTAASRLILGVLLDGPLSTDRFNLTAAHIATDLSEPDRELLLHLIVASLPADVAERLVQGAFDGAGYPTPTLMDDALGEARFWASGANAKELGAYAMASVEKMSKERRAAFLKWMEGRN